jgi:hypothetical protein
MLVYMRRGIDDDIVRVAGSLSLQSKIRCVTSVISLACDRVGILRW